MSGFPRTPSGRPPGPDGDSASHTRAIRPGGRLDREQRQMQSFRHIKDALKPAVKGRRRLVVAAVTAATSFTAGALMPEARVFAGAAVAAVALALLQLILTIIDGQRASTDRSSGTSPDEPTAKQTSTPHARSAG
jgi:hypothetical protein